MSTQIESPSTGTPTRAILLISVVLFLVGLVLRMLSGAEAVGRGTRAAVTGTGHAVAVAVGATFAGIGRGTRVVGRYRTAAACVAAAPIVGGLAVTAYAAIG